MAQHWISLLLASCVALFSLIGTPVAMVGAQDAAEAADDDRDVAVANRLASGCLRTKLDDRRRMRVCNSDDAADAAQHGRCRPSEFADDYLEIRIKCQDWESVAFVSWVLQIVLSELLEVPTTLETGAADAVMQFYDADGRFVLGTSRNNFAAFAHARAVGGDCRNLRQPQAQQQTQTQQASDDDDDDDYLNCAHVIPEVWTARSNVVQGLVRQGVLAAPASLGALGMEGLYVSQWTLERVDNGSSLASWIGMAGAAGRRRQQQGDDDDQDDQEQDLRRRRFLADTFLRPSKWGTYCDEISASKCQEPDGVAQRPPADDAEYNRYFHAKDYTGHFRKTERNDCDRFPHNCTGHVGDFPCGWGGSLQATLHHLDIALESSGDEPYSGGYTYGQLGQIWSAANATRNNVMMMWAIPDPLYEQFQGTDWAMVKVTLPAPTQECLAKRIVAEDRCVADPALRLGVPEGVCDEMARPLHKLLLRDLFDLTTGADIDPALHSPAAEVLSNIQITELQINEMFKYWQATPDDPREAICSWVVDNLEYLQQYIPPTYPRAFAPESSSNTSEPMFWVTTILGALATLLVMATTVLVHKQADRRVFRYAQVEFLYLLLVGSACVAVGAILQGLDKPSNAVCIAQIWLTSVGYTLELVPLLVKVAAINRLMAASSRMRRVTLKKSSLRGGVAVISLLVMAALAVWTVVDPPKRAADYELTGDTTNDAVLAATLIRVEYYCQSNSDFWEYVAVLWNFLLILCATALAFQSRAVKQDFNESQVLSRLIYSHFLFVLLRVMTFFFEPTVAGPMRSIIFSLDTMLVVLIYFLPKFLADDKQGVLDGRSSTRISGVNFNVSDVSRLNLNSVGDSTHFNASTNFKAGELLGNTNDQGPHVHFENRESAPSASSGSGVLSSPLSESVNEDEGAHAATTTENASRRTDSAALEETSPDTGSEKKTDSLEELSDKLRKRAIVAGLHDGSEAG